MSIGLAHAQGQQLDPFQIEQPVMVRVGRITYVLPDGQLLGGEFLVLRCLALGFLVAYVPTVGTVTAIERGQQLLGGRSHVAATGNDDDDRAIRATLDAIRA